jgi:hypothetical protein
MSLFSHWQAQEPQAIGKNLRSLKFNIANRNIPDRLVNYPGPHNKSIYGGYYSLGIWGFPFVVFVVPTYVYAQCKWGGKSAANWGYAAEH